MRPNPQESLERAISSSSLHNEMQVIAAFAERGILDVIPRKDVFTFNAWKDLGRSVKKGEHGVKIPVWIERKKSDDSEESVRFCKMTTVFHVSQTKEN